MLIAQFDSGGEAAGEPPAGSAEAVRLLGDQPDTRALRWARSPEDPGRWVLVAEFETAAGFRRAQSPLPVRAALIPRQIRVDRTPQRSTLAVVGQ